MRAYRAYRPNPSDRDWRRRADLNSLGLAVLLLLIAGLFAHSAGIASKANGLADDIRMNQCGGLYDSVTERILFISDPRHPPPPAQARFYRERYFPKVRERYERAGCSPPLPRIPKGD